MHKPRLYNRDNVNMYGTPLRERNFHTDDGLHAAWSEYSKSVCNTDTLHVTTVYMDGNSDVDVFERVRVEQTYKDYDGEIWEYEKTVQKWDFNPFTFSGEVLPTNKVIPSIASWYAKQNIEYKTITYKVVKDNE